ncbi:alpha/beta fold hydrolase [Amnibacterium sp. CER49]|uniref:alpha/beta fold hydrolase n=1 Tax=Amnibacterium sp. CER49 TaxID=3039161 RepID=UPI002446D482|nr:alpha/beta fold hydrolase [Amnibacterium sp. CER49]MDH2442921.1 alpha/beta fold hydrolase [Amnibacterium sp. CER49]
MRLSLSRPDATIAYSASGPDDAARTLLATHSLTTSRQWEDEAGVLDWSGIAHRGTRLVRFDTRGHGESTGNPDPAQYEWPVLADDLLAVADAVSPQAPIDALGESTGCGTLLWAASRVPSRFRRLVLVIPPTRGPAREQQTQLYLAIADMVELRGMDAWRRMMNAAPLPPLLREGGWSKPRSSGVIEALLPSVLRGAAASVLPDEDALHAIRHPVLVLSWTTDPSHPVETGEYLAEQLPDAELEVASTPDAIRGWGARIADFLAA